MKQFIFNLLFLLVFLFYSSFLIAESDTDEESGHEDQKSYLLFDGISLRSEKKEEWGQRPNYHLNAIFPRLSSDDDKEAVSNFNDLITTFIQTERVDFKADAIENSHHSTALPKTLRKN